MDNGNTFCFFAFLILAVTFGKFHASICKILFDVWHPSKIIKIIFNRPGVGDKRMSCKLGVAGSIPGFSQSVG